MRPKIFSIQNLYRPVFACAFAILLLIVLQSSDFWFRTHPKYMVCYCATEVVNNFKRLWLMSIEKLASRLLNSIIHHQENLFVWSILLTQKNCTTSTIVLPVWIQLYYNVQCSYRKLLTHCLRWWAKKSNILITTRYALHNIIYLMLLCDSIWLNVTQQRNLI